MISMTHFRTVQLGQKEAFRSFLGLVLKTWKRIFSCNTQPMQTFSKLFRRNRLRIGNISFSFILLIHEGSHREIYQEFQGAKGCSDHRFCAPPAYTAQLQTLHQHRANNQYWICLLYTSPSPRDGLLSRMPSSA